MTAAQTGCARAKIPPYYCSTLARSIFAEWGLVKANTRRGVFRVEIMTHRWRARATVSHAQERARARFFLERMILSPNRSHFGGSCARENGMKEATKRAASEALA